MTGMPENETGMPKIRTGAPRKNGGCMLDRDRHLVGSTEDWKHSKNENKIYSIALMNRK